MKYKIRSFYVFSLLFLLFTGCLAPPEFDSAVPKEAENLPAPPAGFSAFTGMDRDSLVVGVNGKAVTAELAEGSSGGRELSRVFLKPGYNCVTFRGFRIPYGGFMQKYACFDVVKSHNYQAKLGSSIYDTTAGTLVLAPNLKGEEQQGSAQLVWSHLGSSPQTQFNIVKGVMATFSQAGEFLEPNRDALANGQYVYDVKPGFYTFTLTLNDKKSLLADSAIVLQQFSFKISAGQTVRMVSSTAGVHLLDAKTDRVLRTPK